MPSTSPEPSRVCARRAPQELRQSLVLYLLGVGTLVFTLSLAEFWLVRLTSSLTLSARAAGVQESP